MSQYWRKLLCFWLATSVSESIVFSWLYTSAAQTRSAPSKRSRPDIPLPEIDFQGTNITNDTIKIAIGQQIRFSSPQSGTYQYWEIDPRPVIYSNFSAHDKGCTTFPNDPGAPCVSYGKAVNLDGQVTSIFYFAQPGKYQISYTYESDGDNASSSATLDVVAPSLIAPQPTVKPVALFPKSCTNDCDVVVGVPRRPVKRSYYGVEVQASATQPKMFPGQFKWVQLIDIGDSYVENGTTYNCKVESGLDDDYPYSDVATIDSKIPNNVLWDIPSAFLQASQQVTSFTEDFAAYDYLLWQPNTSSFVLNSVPVVISYGGWGWYGEADYSQDQHKWLLGSNSNTYTYTMPFTNGYVALGWNEVVPGDTDPVQNPPPAYCVAQ